MSGIIGVRVFRNDAVELIKGFSSNPIFGPKIGLQENHICPEISPIYKVFLVPKNLDERPRCIFYSLSNKEATRFYYDEAMKNKKDDQNLALIKFSHPAVTGFFNDIPSVAQRINKVDAWIKEHGDVNVEYCQQLLENTFALRISDTCIKEGG